jgi:AP-3 complex subunit beta
VREIGSAIARFPSIAASGLSTLMKLLRSHRDNLVAEAVIALKTVILALPASVLGDANTPTPARLVARLAKQLATVHNPKARASIFWLVGQYAGSDTPPAVGIGWEGVQPWVPDVLRLAIRGFKGEVSCIIDELTAVWHRKAADPHLRNQDSRSLTLQLPTHAFTAVPLCTSALRPRL